MVAAITAPAESQATEAIVSDTCGASLPEGEPGK